MVAFDSAVTTTENIEEVLSKNLESLSEEDYPFTLELVSRGVNFLGYRKFGVPVKNPTTYKVKRETVFSSSQNIEWFTKRTTGDLAKVKLASVLAVYMEGVDYALDERAPLSSDDTLWAGGTRADHTGEWVIPAFELASLDLLSQACMSSEEGATQVWDGIESYKTKHIGDYTRAQQDRNSATNTLIDPAKAQHDLLRGLSKLTGFGVKGEFGGTISEDQKLETKEDTNKLQSWSEYISEKTNTDRYQTFCSFYKHGVIDKKFVEKLAGKGDTGVDLSVFENEFPRYDQLNSEQKRFVDATVNALVGNVATYRLYLEQELKREPRG